MSVEPLVEPFLLFYSNSAIGAPPIFLVLYWDSRASIFKLGSYKMYVGEGNVKQQNLCTLERGNSLA